MMHLHIDIGLHQHLRSSLCHTHTHTHKAGKKYIVQPDRKVACRIILTYHKMLSAPQPGQHFKGELEIVFLYFPFRIKVQILLQHCGTKHKKFEESPMCLTHRYATGYCNFIKLIALINCMRKMQIEQLDNQY